MTRDYGIEAQAAAEAHLEACFTALFEESEDGTPQWPETAAPFCGCETCTVREVLHAAWPILLEAARAEVAR